MARVALLGVPNDDNSSHMQGPAQAPAHIRRELHCDAYSLWSESGIDLGVAGRLVDHGDVVFDTATDPWPLIEQAVDRILDQRCPLICLGGDHAITHPILRAVRRHHEQLTILHIDAHADIYDCYQGNPRSHASPFARIMEERLADRLIQVGLRTVNDHHREQFRRFAVEVHEAADCSADMQLDIRTPVYISLDLDGLDPAYAPGVSHREPGGLSTRTVINLIRAIGQPIVGADIVEYNPRCDFQNTTAVVAAKLLKEIAGMMLKAQLRGDPAA